MKKLVWLIAMALSVIGTPIAQAKSMISGGPYTNLDPVAGKIHLNVSNFPKDKGIYIFQVVRNRASENARPTIINMDNAVDLTPNSNHADVIFNAVGKFGSTDCSLVECALWAQFDGASGSYQVTDEDQYISSLSFTASTAITNPADFIDASINGVSLSTTSPGSLMYRAPVTINVKTNSGAVATIKSSTPDCSVKNNTVEALKGTGGCDFEITSPGNSSYSQKITHFPFQLLPANQVINQKIKSLKVGKSTALTNKTNFGEAISYVSNTKKICTTKGGTVTAIKAGSCVLTVTAAGSPNYAAVTTSIILPAL